MALYIGMHILSLLQFVAFRLILERLRIYDFMRINRKRKEKRNDRTNLNF